ncbi:MAG: 2Fe-2S iron-sulfur cluster binding domain-containing protein [Flavobacteriales bacterium]|nr:2Fe-2S iron-sulfur cluster binding domain-containing protein [Flavobacteriales bacterium]
MAAFHQLKVKDVREETSDCVSVEFDVPKEIKEDFQFIHGQFLTFKMDVKGEELRRCYSICTGPGNGSLRVAIKRVVDGRVSNWINDELRKGDELTVMTPMGSFFSELHPDNAKNYVLFAGGSGVTPMVSILKAVLKTELNSKVILFYGNLTESAVIFKKELDDLQSKHADRFRIQYILEKPVEEVDELTLGIMSKDKITELMRLYVDTNVDSEYFVCGPTGMKDSVMSYLDATDIDKNTIHVEIFASDPLPVETDLEQSEEALEAIESCEATIILDGDEYTATINKGEVVLDVALEEGMDAPYSCRGGMCSTCRAKVTEGKAEMRINSALTDGEVEEGYILTCQAFPLTATLTVDYDEAL